MYNFYPKKLVQPPGCAPNILLIMKLTTLILVAAILQVSASTFAQKITLSEKNTPLNKVFEKISDQTGYDFIVSTENLKLSKPVNVNVRNEDLKPALDKIFINQPLRFVIQEKIVVVFMKDAANTPKTVVTVLPLILKGRITDTTGLALPGATIKNRQTTQAAISGIDGKFALNCEIGDELQISFVGFDPVNYLVKKDEAINIIMRPSASKLNEIQVIGYGTVTKRLNTGSVSTVSAKEIDQQPVTNVLSALSGRAAGLFVQTTNGLPGGNVSLQIRGKGSITAGTDPLYIIDGVPFSTTIGTLNGATSLLAQSSINGNTSPFNSLNPTDIESISILKDGDATAIYGSRGSNGVVLITTKKGKAGKTTVDIKVNNGISNAANLPSLLNLEQYLQIRREAFKNDNKTPSADPLSANYAPELTVWNQTESTNWPKYLLGTQGRSTDVQSSITGGTANTSFALSGNYHSENTILPGKNLYQRGGIHFNFQHTSPNKKFFLQFSNSLGLDNNKLANPTYNLLGDLLTPPNYPIYEASGNLNWYTINPYAEVLATSKANTTNSINNLILRYAVAKDINVQVSAGYNYLYLNQTQLFPSASLYPSLTNYTNFGTNSNRSFIIEPQVEYKKRFEKSSLTVLIGGTYQSSMAEGDQIVASNFSNPLLMENFSSAATVTLSNNFTEYKFASLFARLNYILHDKYIINLSARRDGSSKFGPENRFGNFGALGLGWLFGSEDFVKENIAFLSFGKLRASYGVTGNDQITPYQYLSTYSSSGNIYQGISALRPARISNSNFHWETTGKFDLALELGFLNDRFLPS
ncbi:MAG: SusC/RagA family TonB-linked outer membrane protein [Bacteroidota bacterium]